jgi:protein O-mannosyl-transferase
MVSAAHQIPRRSTMRLLLLVAILLAFGRILSNDFVDWDDGKLIYDNPNITHGTLEGLAREWNWRDANTFGLYDPLVYTSWWLLAHAAKIQTPDSLGATINPQVFHAANLIVHWLAACVVLEILARIGIGGWPGFAGALLFAIHPLQTEAVAWATGMKDLLGGLFALATIWRYLVATQSEGVARRNNFIAATLLCFAALLSKPSAVILPLVVVCFDLYLFRRSIRRSLPWLGAWLLMGVAAIVLNASLQPFGPRMTPWPIWSRPLIGADALNFYLCKVLVPIHLSFDYGRTPFAMLHDPLLHSELYWSWIFPAILALIAWRLLRPVPAVAALVFFLGLLPVLGLIPFAYQYFSTVADRYIYLSMLGVAMAAAWALDRYGNRMIWCAAGAVLVLLMSLSFLQAGVWKDTDTLYAHALSLNPTNGTHYLFVAEYEEKEAELALRRTTLAISQGNAEQAHTQDEEARRLMRKAVEFRRQEIKYDPADVEGPEQLSRDLKFLGESDQANH